MNRSRAAGTYSALCVCARVCEAVLYGQTQRGADWLAGGGEKIYVCARVHTVCLCARLHPFHYSGVSCAISAE